MSCLCCVCFSCVCLFELFELFELFALCLGAGVSESARCALEPAEGQAFAAALVVDGRYLCAHVACALG